MVTRLLGNQESQLLEEPLIVFVWLIRCEPFQSGVHQASDHIFSCWKSLTPSMDIHNMRVVPVE